MSGDEDELWGSAEGTSWSSGLHDRVVLHFDLDCFYAQVEALEDPSLRDVPFAVRQKQILITTNYVARAMGVPKNGMAADILRRFPQLRVVCGEDLRQYRKYSLRVHQVLRQELGPSCPVERLGMDENFADVTSLVDKPGSDDECGDLGKVFGNESLSNSNQQHGRLAAGMRIAKRARLKILQETGLTSSAGIATNKLLAKLVGKCHKPNDQTALLPDSVSSIMVGLDGVRSIPGIGSSTAHTLRECGIESVRDLQNADVGVLSKSFDVETAQRLRSLSLGRDDAPVKMSEKAKSIGLEDRFRCIDSAADCKDKLRWMLGRLAALIYEDGRAPQSVKLSVRDAVKDRPGRFTKESRQCRVSPSLFADLKKTDTLSERSVEDLLGTAMRLLEKAVDLKHKFHLTLLGLSVGDFVEQPAAGGSIASFFKKDSTPVVAAIKRKFPGEHNLPTSEEKASIAANKDELRCPHGWDEEVFASLPNELQKELLQNQNHENQAAEPPVQAPKKAKTDVKGKSSNTILKYFKTS